MRRFVALVALACVAADEPLPPGAVARLGGGPFHLGSACAALAYHPNGQVLFAVGTNGVLTAFEAATGDVIQRVEGLGFATNLAVSPNGDVVAVTTMAGHAYRLPFAGGRLGKGEWLHADGKRLDAVAFVDGGRTLVTGGGGMPFRTWDSATGREKDPFPQRAGGIHFLQSSADGKSLLSLSGFDDEVCVWDATTRKRRCRIKSELPGFAALSPDGRWAAVGEATRLTLYHADTGKQKRVWTLPPELEPIKRVFSTGIGPVFWYGSFAFTPDGKSIVVANGRIHRLPIPDGTSVPPVEVIGSVGEAMAISPDGRRLVIGTRHAALTVYDLGTNRVIAAPDRRGGVNDVAWSPDGSRVVGAYEDGRARVWDVKAKRVVAETPEHDREIHRTRFGTDGRHLFSLEDPVRNKDTFIRRWVSDGLRASGAYPGGDFTVAGGRVFIGRGADLVTIDEASGRELRVTPNLVRVGVGEHVRVAPSADGRWAAVTGKAGVRVVNAITGEPSREFQPDEGRCATPALSPDGRAVAVTAFEELGSGASRVRLYVWERESEELRFALRVGLNEVIRGLAFSPDGRQLAAGQNPNEYYLLRGNLLVWDAHFGTELACHAAHGNSVHGASFSPDRKHIASASEDGLIYLWHRPEVPFRDGSPDAAWEALAGPAPDAARAIAWFVSRPDVALTTFADRLRPAVPSNSDAVKALLADLDATRYAVRVRANRALGELDLQAEDALRAFLKSDLSAEARRSAQRLLDRLAGPLKFPDRLREVRSVEALESIATPEARTLLERLATGDPKARLTREAKQSLNRLR